MQSTKVVSRVVNAASTHTHQWDDINTLVVYEPCPASFKFLAVSRLVAWCNG